MNLDEIKNKIRKFADDRNWEQYHTPKNLSMALSAEAGELLEIFQWLNDDESKKLSEKDLQSTKEELADIMIYLIRIADRLNIDLEDAIEKKLKINSEKYPIELSKNNAIKYNKR
tara:strand:+ start:38 stop:382 length:345 start_codon:yes stop_codon:yes gene_type:complete